MKSSKNKLLVKLLT